MISDAQGIALVSLARRAVEKYLSEGVLVDPDDSIQLDAGVFVTLNYLTRDRDEHLRGCIGFPIPQKKLAPSVIEAAIAAATQDPRFPPVDQKELANVIFEVSVLTPPKALTCKPSEYKTGIRVGRDGLILHWKHGSGLLLPQVPVEMKWDVDEYLANICYKAGAPQDAWLDPASKLYTFQALVFKELEPRGHVSRMQI
jgi:hypothetical protein